MVMQALSFSRSGLTDFVIQRVSAVILGAYSLCLLGFFLGVCEALFASVDERAD